MFNQFRQPHVLGHILSTCALQNLDSCVLKQSLFFILDLLVGMGEKGKILSKELLFNVCQLNGVCFRPMAIAQS